MKTTVYLIISIILFLLAGAIPVGTNNAELIIFQTPMFMLLLAVLCGLILHCIFKQRFSWSKLGFYFSHVGIVILLGGALLGSLWGQQTQFSIPISETMDFWDVPTLDGDQVDLGFGISVTSFNVDHFEPDYALYKPIIITENGLTKTDYELEKRIRMENGVFDLGESGTIEATTLRLGDSTWREQHLLSNGKVLVMYPLEERHYLANFRVRDSQEQLSYYNLEVNHPVNYKGWWFYLMSYDPDLKYVVLSARNDPGRVLVIIGIWITMLGTAALCWGKQKPLFKGAKK